jgi:hypothetical protein
MRARNFSELLMNNWNIQSRAHACQVCEKSFSDKEKYHTVLTDAKSDYIRLDLCVKCWDSQYSDGANERKGFISHWQGVYEQPPEAPPEPIQKASAESLLRELVELNDPEYAAASYILAVMLERKRQLRVKEQFKRDGQRVFVYEQPKTFDIFTIPDPDLQLNQLDEVQHQVGRLLEHGLNPPSEDTPVIEADAEIAGPNSTDATDSSEEENAQPEPAQS